MKSVFVIFGLLACAIAAPILAPPDCPQLLAAAQQAVTDADSGIQKATDDLTVIGKQLDTAVDTAAQQQSQASKSLNIAVNKENVDKSILANDQAHLLDARNNLTNIQNDCKSPAPPTNCPQLETEADATIKAWENTVDSDNSVIQNDDVNVAYDQQVLQRATDAYNTAVSNRTTVTKELRDDLQTAVNVKSDAMKHLQDVEQQCQMFVSVNQIAPPADCPTLLDQAAKAITDCDAQLATATNNYNAEIPKLDASVNTAQGVINNVQATLNADTNRDNYDRTILGNDAAHLQDAKNDLVNIRTTCAGPNPPGNCAQLIQDAQNKVDADTTTVTNDQAKVDADDQQIAQDKNNLSNAQKSYQDTVALRDSTRKQLQQAIDDATSAKNQAQAHYEEVQKECQQF